MSDALWVTAGLVLVATVQVAVLVVVARFFVPTFRGYRSARQLHGTYLGFLKSDRRTLLVLVSWPGSERILAVRPEGQVPFPFDELWSIHQSHGVRWHEVGFENFELAVRRNAREYPSLVAALDEHRREARRSLPLAIVLTVVLIAVVLIIVVYLDREVLRVGFSRI